MNKRPNKHALATQDSNPIYPALSDQIVLAPFDPFGDIRWHAPAGVTPVNLMPFLVRGRLGTLR